MKTGLRAGQHVLRTLALAAAMALAASCRSAAPGSADPVPVADLQAREPQYEFLPAARVVRVNAEDGYVVLECTVLPSPGEEAKVYRENAAVADLVVTTRRHGPYVIADTRAGDVRRGDMVKFRCVVGATPQEVAP